MPVRDKMPGGAQTNANGLAFEAAVNLGQFDGTWFECFEVQSGTQYGFLRMVPTLQDYDLDWNDRKADTGIMITNMRNGMRSFLIIEKKFQRVEGSVDSKFLAGKAFREIWTRTLDVPGNNLHEVRYAFVVNDWVYENIIMKKGDIRYILDKDNIPLFTTLDAEMMDNIQALLFDMMHSLAVAEGSRE